MTEVREQFQRPRLVSSLRGACRRERAITGDRERALGCVPGDGFTGLTLTTKDKVLPALVTADMTTDAAPTEPAMSHEDSASDEIAALADQMLAGDTEGASLRIETLRARGCSLEELYLQLLAPAALHLRRQWRNDLCGFAEATLALWHLQKLLRSYAVAFRAEAERQATGQRALLAPTPREKHDLSYAMFYLVLMSEFFRRDGWEPWIEPEPTSREFSEVIRREWFDVVEFLVGGDQQLDALASRIRMIRRESPNRSIGVMVYGQVFIEHPELVLLVGADLTATDVRQGALQAQRLVGQTSRS
jgi:hypothetical protein